MDGRRIRTEANPHVVSNIHTTWLESVKNRADTSSQRKPPSEPTIFRVPPEMHYSNRSVYEPKLVSIGPYHRGKSEDLKAMEELKWWLLHHYLSNVPNGSMNEGLTKLRDLEKRARDCYSEVIDLDSDQFVEMLLLDGYFLVQILYLQAEELRSLLFKNRWFYGHIFRDLMLLENQLPYFIIEHLLDMLVPKWDRSWFQKVAISYFVGFLPHYVDLEETKKQPGQFFEVDHLLHLLHQWISSVLKSDKASNTRNYSKLSRELPCSALSAMINAAGNCLSKVLPWCSNSSNSKRLPPTVPTTTELVEAGVKIKESKAISFLHISFCKDKGVLEIPAIEISDSTNLFFANLTALEQCSCKHNMDVTHYIVFLDNIINTARDVELLHQEGIVHRCLGSDVDIASLFNNLGNGVYYDLNVSYLKVVYQDLNAYCRSRWPRWRAKAKHDYFSNPWAIISLGADVLLIGLAILQSVYTILSYYKQN